MKRQSTLSSFFKGTNTSAGPSAPKSPQKDCDVEADKGDEEENESTSKVASKSTFLPKWNKEFPWILYDEKSGKVKCRVCQQQCMKLAIATSGTSNLQHSTFARHEQTKDHLFAVSSSKQVGKLLSVVEAQSNDVSENELVQFRTVYYLATEEIADRKYKTLMMLQRANGVQDITEKTINTHHTTVTAIETSLANVLIEEVEMKIARSPFISVLIDESTDVAVTKKLIVYVKLFTKDFQTETHFWSNLSVNCQCTATNITKVLKQFLSDKNVPLAKVIGFGTDGASIMMGSENGVGIQLKQDSPLMIHVHCVAHKLALSVSQAAENVPEVAKIQDLLNSLYKFFSSSTNNNQKLKNMQQVLDEQVISLKHQHSVRWLSLGRAVDAVVRSYDAIVLVLTEMKASSEFTKKKSTTQTIDKSFGLLKSVSEYSFVSLLCLLADILEIMDRLSKAFQSDLLSFSEVVDKVITAKARLEAMKTHPGVHLQHFFEQTEDCNSGYYEDIKLSMIPTSKSSFGAIRNKFIDKLLANLNTRFDEVTKQFFANLDRVLNPAAPPSTTTVDEAFDHICEYFCNDEFRHIYGDLLPTEVELREEWLSIQQLLKKYKGMKLQDFCNLVCSATESGLETDFTYREFRKLAIIGSVMPMSTAACERGFATQNRIKSKKRNRLSDSHLEVLMRLSSEGPRFAANGDVVTCDMDFERAVKKFKKGRK